MRTWCALNQKGGAGKTTLLLNLAIASLADNETTTTIVDLDPQKSSSQWAAYREAVARKKRFADELVVVAGTELNLDQMIAKARTTGTDLLLIDTPPAVNDTMILSAEAADLLIVPTRTDFVDRKALEGTLKRLRAMNMLWKTVVVLNAERTDKKSRNEVVAIATGDYHTPVVTAGLPYSLDFNRALETGRGVTEAKPNDKPARQVVALLRLLTQWDRKLNQSKRRLIA